MSKTATIGSAEFARHFQSSFRIQSGDTVIAAELRAIMQPSPWCPFGGHQGEMGNPS